MKKSEYLYGKKYDKSFVRKHSILFETQIEWAKQLLIELEQEPLIRRYFDFDTMTYKQFPVRDLVRINHCLEAIKWNRSKIDETK